VKNTGRTAIPGNATIVDLESVEKDFENKDEQVKKYDRSVHSFSQERLFIE
jgi:hypothetical protein